MTGRVLAPHLKSEFHWTNQDFAWIVIAFRLSYTVMQAIPLAAAVLVVALVRNTDQSGRGLLKAI